jgi:uncharacterized RDD family membrane protein YckC
VAANLPSIPGAAQPYQGQRAGLVTRATAAVIDAAVVTVLVLGGYVAVNGLLFLIDPRGFQFTEASPLPGVTTWLVVLVLYLSATWSVSGRTYGCYLMGLRVVNSRGRVVRPYVAVLRAVLYALFPIGLLFCAGGRNRRSLQDLILRTAVVYDWRR